MCRRFVSVETKNSQKHVPHTKYEKRSIHSPICGICFAHLRGKMMRRNLQVKNTTQGKCSEVK